MEQEFSLQPDRELRFEVHNDSGDVTLTVSYFECWNCNFKIYIRKYENYEQNITFILIYTNVVKINAD